MSEFKDFDKAYEELTNKKLEFKVAGRNYSIPGQLPASVVLGQLSILNEDGSIDPTQITKFLAELVGEENLQDMMDAKVSWKQLEDLLNWLLIQYNVIPDPEAEEVVAEGDEDSPK
tara:strand:- start:6897 stop:7244 length:348 start_codon:yes stop_codon:yes gene_type:complete